LNGKCGDGEMGRVQVVLFGGLREPAGIVVGVVVECCGCHGRRLRSALGQFCKNGGPGSVLLLGSGLSFFVRR